MAPTASLAYRRPRPRGAVSVEVLMALLPLLLVFFGITQLALLKMGQLVVAHAAHRAVRSAVVILDDDPKYYDGAPRGDLLAGAPASTNKIFQFMAEVNNEYAELVGDGKRKGGARLDAIRQVAYFPLSVLAPSPETLLGARDLKTTVGGHPLTRFGLASYAYNRVAASVSVHTEQGGDAVEHIGPHAAVTVRVAYLMRCGVPLVGSLMCSGGYDLGRASLGIPSSRRAREAIAGLSHVESPLLRDALFTQGAAYTLIVAEATLPNQGANYHRSPK